MKSRESGLVACNALPSQQIEAIARFAYSLGGMSPKRPDGTGALLEQLVGSIELITLVDIGMRDRDAVVRFLDDGERPHVKVRIASVRIGARQSPEDTSISCARACALILEWVRAEHWGGSLTAAVTIAIAMPTPAFLAEMGQLCVEQLASAYVVPIDCVIERVQMLRRGSESGPRHAVTRALYKSKKFPDHSL